MRKKRKQIPRVSTLLEILEPEEEEAETQGEEDEVSILLEILGFCRQCRLYRCDVRLFQSFLRFYRKPGKWAEVDADDVIQFQSF